MKDEKPNYYHAVRIDEQSPLWPVRKEVFQLLSALEVNRPELYISFKEQFFPGFDNYDLKDSHGFAIEVRSK